MATNNENYAYTYDPTGKLPDNLIKNERHDVQPPTGIEDSSLFFLRAAPAFQESIVLRKGPTDTSALLLEGVDYILTHKFLWKSWELTKPIYGSVTMINRNYTGEVYANYQSLGGGYVIDDQSYLERLARDVYRSRYVYWEQVSKNLPGLPPFDHTMSGTDVIGWDLVVDAILRLVAAVYDTANGSTGGGSGGSGEGSAGLNQHLTSTTAHKLSSVGGSNLFNYAMASDIDFENEALNKYTNPAAIVLWVRRYITSLGLGTLNNDVVQLRNRVVTIENNIVTLRDDANLQKALLDELAANYDTLKDRQDAIETTVAEAVSDIPVIKDDIASIKRQLNGEEDTGLGLRVGTLETKSTQHGTDIAGLKEDQVENDSRLTALEAGGGGGPGGSGDLDQRVTVVEEKLITHDDSIIDLEKANEIAALGYNPAQLVFFGTVGKEIVLKPNDTLQVEFVTPGRFTTDSVYDYDEKLYNITGIVTYEDGTSKRIVEVTEGLTETNGSLDDKGHALRTADVILFERTLGTASADENGAAGRTLNGVVFGKGAKVTDELKKGSSSGTYFKFQYKNVGIKNIGFRLYVSDIRHSLKETIPADVLNNSLESFEPYLRGEAGYLCTVTKGA